MESCPLEIIWTILQKLDYNTILIYCQTCKSALDILNIKAFWIQKSSRHDIGPNIMTRDTFMNTSLVPNQRYLQILTENHELACGSERFMNPKHLMRRAIQQGRKDIVQYLISLGFDDWSLILEEYAIINDIESITHYLSKSQNFDIVAYGALVGGHKDLFDAVRPPEDYNYDWNLFVSGVLRANNPELFTYVLLLLPEYVLDWQRLCETLVLLGHRTVFDYIRGLVPDYTFDYARLGYMASSNNNLEFFDYIRSSTDFNIHNWKKWTYGAVESGNQEMFDHIRSLGEEDWEYNWNKIMYIALFNDQRNLFNYICTVIPEDYEPNWDKLIKASINSRNPYLIKYILSLLPHDLIINWNEILLYTMVIGCKILFNKVLELIPDCVILNWNDITRRMTNSLGEIII